MHGEIFTELSLVIVVAAVVSLIMRLLRQPLILGYILTGLIAGPSLLGLIHSTEAFEGFSTIGISLLLFIIGLGLNITVIRKLGSTAFICALVELIVIGGIGFGATTLLGFSLTTSLIIGLALFFSSTIIIVKFLSDKKEQNRLHGQIAIGVILLEDIVATFALLFVVAAGDKGGNAGQFIQLIISGAVLAIALTLTAKYVLPRFVTYLARSQEMLFLFAIAWGFGVASLFELGGFSIEVGALFAGVALASLPYAQEIEARLKPLRDFFVVLFFITLGQSLNVTNLGDAVVPALILSAIVILLKPLSIITTLGLLGYPKRVSFLAGINLSQISEFSIVLVVLAANVGLIDESVSAILTLVAVITIASSSYMMQYDDWLYKQFSRFRLKLFERADKVKDKKHTTAYPILLFGYHRGGHEFVRTFKRQHHRYLVIDYDPAVIETLKAQHIPCMYGDAADAELLEEVGVKTAKLIVTTITDTETNQELIRHINFYNPEAAIVCNANSYEEALQLYEMGASYVMIPHFAGSERLSSLIERNGIDRRHFDRYRSRHLDHLEKNHPLSLADEAI